MAQNYPSPLIIWCDSDTATFSHLGNPSLCRKLAAICPSLLFLHRSLLMTKSHFPPDSIDPSPSPVSLSQTCLTRPRSPTQCDQLMPGRCVGPWCAWITTPFFCDLGSQPGGTRLRFPVLFERTLGGPRIDAQNVKKRSDLSCDFRGGNVMT